MFVFLWRYSVSDCNDPFITTSNKCFPEILCSVYKCLFVRRRCIIQMLTIILVSSYDCVAQRECSYKFIQLQIVLMMGIIDMPVEGRIWKIKVFLRFLQYREDAVLTLLITIGVVSAWELFKVHYVASKRPRFVGEDICDLAKLLIQVTRLDPCWHVFILIVHFYIPHHKNSLGKSNELYRHH